MTAYLIYHTVRVTLRYITVILVLYSGQCLAGSENVVLQTDLGSLAATLELPDDKVTKALVLIVPGSGPTDRNGNSVGSTRKNNSLKYLAEALNKSGIASLRYDKRLIGESASEKLTERDIRFDSYINDAKLWFAYLNRRFEVPIYILGHSQGSLIGIVAAKSVETAGLISIAGPGRPAPEILLEQINKRFPETQAKQSAKIISELVEGKTVGSTPPELAALFRPGVQPYLISWFKYDPAEEISTLQIPVLLIYGSTDIQVPTSDGQILRRSLPAAKLLVIDGMNHIFKLVGTDIGAQLKSYGDPNLPISGELVDKIVGFVVQ